MAMAAAEDFAHEMDVALGWLEEDEEKGGEETVLRWASEAHAQIAREREARLDGLRSGGLASVEEHFADEEVAVAALLVGPLSRFFRLDVMLEVDDFEEYVEFLEVEEQHDLFGVVDLSEDQEDARKRTIGVKRFNMKPKDGLKYLQESGLLGREAEDVANFLLHTEGLYKSSIGAYLGEGKEFNVSVLRSFVSTFSFEGDRLDEAMRAFLATFRLPGEAQKIDRIMETFAERYHTFHPKLFASPDTAYVLAFALIMLNTDAHNPGVKNKMTLEQFFSTTRGIDSGNDIDKELLTTLYRSIVENEINLKPDGPSTPFDSPDFRGALKKQSTGRLKKWNTRFFLLSGSCLYYFGSEAEAEADGAPRGILPLENVAVVDMGSKHKTQFALQAGEGLTLKMAKLKGSSNLKKGGAQLVLRAPDEETKEAWMSALRAHSDQDTFYELMHQKKTDLHAEVEAQGGTSQAAAAVLERRNTESRTSLARVRQHRKRRASHTLEEMIAQSPQVRASTLSRSSSLITLKTRSRTRRSSQSTIDISDLPSPTALASPPRARQASPLSVPPTQAATAAAVAGAAGEVDDDGLPSLSRSSSALEPATSSSQLLD